MHPVAVICVALLGLLLFGLGLLVSLSRGKYKVLIDYPLDPADPMHKRVRAHGNTAEYAPFLAILFLYHGAQQPASWVLWFMAIGTAARFLIAIGLITCKTLEQPNPLRFAGALGTYVVGITLALAMLRSVLS